MVDIGFFIIGVIVAAILLWGWHLDDKNRDKRKREDNKTDQLIKDFIKTDEITYMYRNMIGAFEIYDVQWIDENNKINKEVVAVCNNKNKAFSVKNQYESERK